MHATYEVQLSKEEYVIGLDALFGELAKADPARSRRIFERLAAFVLIIMAASWFFPEGMMGLFFVILAIAVVEALMVNRWTKSAHGVSYDPSIGPQLFEFTDEAITESSANRKRQWRWAAVRRIHDREAALVFELAGWDMIALPSRLWTSPEERHRFVEEVRSHISPDVGEAVSTTPAPSPMKADLFTIAAISAFVDVCLIFAFSLPLDAGRSGPIAGQLGFASAILVVILLAGALGYLAYRLTKAGLPRLNERSPAAASFVAQVLIWAFAAWFGATAIGLI